MTYLTIVSPFLPPGESLCYLPLVTLTDITALHALFIFPCRQTVHSQLHSHIGVIAPIEWLPPSPQKADINLRETDHHLLVRLFKITCSISIVQKGS